VSWQFSESRPSIVSSLGYLLMSRQGRVIVQLRLPLADARRRVFDTESLHLHRLKRGTVTVSYHWLERLHVMQASYIATWSATWELTILGQPQWSGSDCACEWSRDAMHVIGQRVEGRQYLTGTVLGCILSRTAKHIFVHAWDPEPRRTR
jgi:hypothetical protein